MSNVVTKGKAENGPVEVRVYSPNRDLPATSTSPAQQISVKVVREDYSFPPVRKDAEDLYLEAHREAVKRYAFLP